MILDVLLLCLLFPCIVHVHFHFIIVLFFYRNLAVFSKRQRITLRLLYAISISSVVCLSVSRLLSVTLVHPTQPVEIFGNFFRHTIAQGL